MFNFLIDTADEAYIKNKWKQIKNVVPKENVVGITTNPNAFYKTGDFTIEQWRKRAHKLCSLLREIRGDKEGTLHVQFPNSNLTEQMFKKWIKIVSTFTNGDAKIAVKVPPYKKSLEIACKYRGNISLNTTGIADAGTALFALTHDIEYASIIPGRMEEVKIDAKSHVGYVMNSIKGNKKLITGSMRTLKGLKWCVEYGTLPTIGTRVLDLINEENCSMLLDWNQVEVPKADYCPLSDKRNLNLSEQFFIQMDSMGQKAYEDLIQ